jgi:hypothetical protein
VDIERFAVRVRLWCEDEFMPPHRERDQ